MNSIFEANTFCRYLIGKGYPKVDFEHFSKLELNDVLQIFYLDIWKVDGGKYKTSSLEQFRHSLNCYLETSSKFNIIKNTDFADANLSYRMMLTEWKRDWLGITKHYPIINTPDLEKLYKSYLFNINIPTGLLLKVQFDVCLYFKMCTEWL